MSEIEDEVEGRLDTLFSDYAIGVTLVYICTTDIEEAWMRDHRGKNVCNDRYVVSERGMGTYFGVRRKSPHE